MMIRLLGAACLMLGALSLSHAQDSRRAARHAAEAVWLRLLHTLRRELCCYARPFAAFIAAYGDTALEKIGLLSPLREVGTLAEAFTLMQERLPTTPPFAAVLESFAASFGQGYREGELRALDAVIAEAEAIYKKEEEELPRRRRLSHTLCVSLSLAVVMLLL